MSDILFITPPIPLLDGPEIGLLSIASYVEQELPYSVRMLDMNTELIRDTDTLLLPSTPRMSLEMLGGIIVKEKPRIVAVGGATSYVQSSLEVLKTIKAIDAAIVTIIGGHHVSAVMQSLLEEHAYVDYAVYGEGEDTFIALATAILTISEKRHSILGTIARYNDDIIVNEPRPLRDTIDYYPFPNRSLVSIKNYTKPYRIISSRGCPFDCTFCLRTVHGKTWRGRSPQNVVDEIERLVKQYGWKTFTFSDDNFTLDKKRVYAIVDELNKRSLTIEWDTGTGVRADCLDDELLAVMRRGGCRRIGIGIESGNEHILRAIKKNTQPHQILDSIKRVRKHGLNIHGSFMIGNQGDTIQTIDESINFALECIRAGLTSISWNMATPYPGTQLWEYVCREGHLFDTDYTHYKHHTDMPLFETNDFTAKERVRMLRKAKKITARTLMIKRVGDRLKRMIGMR